MGHVERQGTNRWFVIGVAILVCAVARATSLCDVLELVRNW